MAIFQNDPFPGTDYTRFLEWEKVTTPAGQVFYVVPGNPAYVYDPVASNASGRKVFRANPQEAISRQKEEEEALRKQREQQEFNNSPTGQILPVAASTGGLIAASQLGAFGGGAAPVVAPAAGAAAAGTAGGAVAGGAAAAPLATPTIVSVAPAGTAAGGTAAGSGATTAGASAFLLPAAAAAGTYLLGKGAYDLYKGEEDNSTQGKAGRAQLAYTTMGLSELARWGGWLGQPSTRDVARKHTSELREVAPEDQEYQAYVEGMRKQYDSDPVDPTKPFAGKYGSWDEYVAGGLEAGDLTGVYGNIKTYGPAWASLTQEQRQAITQANIDDGLYYSKKGEVEITDPVKAKENFDRITAEGFDVGATPPVPPAGGITNKPAAGPRVPLTPAQAAAMGTRSSTISPGIGLNGQRIPYK